MRKLTYSLLIACLVPFCSCQEKDDTQDTGKDGDPSTEKKLEEKQETAPFNLGEAAHIAIGTKNAQESAAFYEKLGFQRIQEDSIPYPWVRMTDGCVIININQDSMQYMGMTYFTANPDKVFPYLDSIGIEYWSKIPDEEGNLKQVIAMTPDSALGFSVIAHDPSNMKWPSTLNMRAMMSDEEITLEDSPNVLCGMFGEFSARVDDLEKSIEFWKQLGFTSINRGDQPYPFAILTDGITIFGLHQSGIERWDYPALTYFRGDTRNFLEKIKSAGIADSSIEELEDLPGHYVLTSPEGQHVFLFKM